ncbi:response regulator [Marivirga sp. S37H4]|uniref:Response regulator n=1 Tax=Marivirga aurantiaca TaxID=2802615 RepID=A0A934WVP5_9BACT|nr:response regulator [Marivirga aurantiaca]MBK6263909.1 response regulator [Marivirga aurantiaca]
MKNQNLLLIDDDKEDQEIFLEALVKVSTVASCITMQDAAVALQKLSANDIFPDLIFLDLNMPGMNGEQFLLEIKRCEKLRKVPVIILSSSSHLSNIQLSIDLGAGHFITKTNPYEEFLQELSYLLN